MVQYRSLCFAYWSGTGHFVLLIGPVQNVLFCSFVRYTTLCLLIGPVPKFETASSRAGNHRLPLQGTPGSQRLKLFVPTFKTIRYHYKELPVPRDWKYWLRTLEPKLTIARNSRFPEVGASGYQPWNTMVTIAKNCRFPQIGTPGSQLGNYRLP